MQLACSILSRSDSCQGDGRQRHLMMHGQCPIPVYSSQVQTYCSSQLRKMLILLISSYCKMCTLPTLRSRVFVCCEHYKHARWYCWQWTHFTMGPNEQNQQFAELRNFIHTRSSAPNMFDKFGWKTRTFCHKKVAKVIIDR